MIDSIVALSKKLIAIKTNPHNRPALEEALAVVEKELQGFTIEKFERNGYKSILAYHAKTRPEQFKIILNGHLDIIPGKDHQYVPRIQGDKLYGVGALDMKSNLSCLLHVFKEIAPKVSYPIGIQIVTEEELGGFDGTKYQIEEGVRADFVISSETTNLNIVNKAKGIMWVKIATKGVTAHGAYPWRGKNAVWKMHEFLDVLKKKYPVPLDQQWVTTVNLSSIKTSNKTYNKIPDDCEVCLDIRFIPEDAKTIADDIKSLLPADFTIEYVTNEPALDVDASNEYLLKLQETGTKILGRDVECYGAQGSSDARHFTRVNCAGVEFGAIGGGIGSDEEWISISSLDKYYTILHTYLLSLQ